MNEQRAKGDPCVTVTLATLERVTREPCSSDSNEQEKKKKKKIELSRVAFHPVTDSINCVTAFLFPAMLRGA